MLCSSSELLGPGLKPDTLQTYKHACRKEPGQEFRSHTVIPEIDITGVLLTGVFEEASLKIRSYKTHYKFCYYPS